MVAAWANQPNSIKMLSSYPGVHLDAVSRNNMDTALHMAAVRGHTDVAVALVHCGAKTHMRNEQNQTPADLAAYLGNAKTAQALRHLDPETQNGLVQSLTKNATKALEFIQEMAPIRLRGPSDWQDALIFLGLAPAALIGLAALSWRGPSSRSFQLALVLAGLGVNSLSMAPSKVRAVRTALALHDYAQCQQMAAAARASVGPKEAREVVLSMADPVLADLL